MKPPIKRLSNLRGGCGVVLAEDNKTYASPTPRVARRKPGKVLTADEKAAFLASRPDLKSDG